MIDLSWSCKMIDETTKMKKKWKSKVELCWFEGHEDVCEHMWSIICNEVIKRGITQGILTMK